jgi:hypothetical protein
LCSLTLELSGAGGVRLERIVRSVASEIFQHVAAANDLLARNHLIEISNVDGSVNLDVLQRGHPVGLALLCQHLGHLINRLPIAVLPCP